jgi:hypothetical protein
MTARSANHKQLFASSLLAFVASYLFGSLAIDRGNIGYYGMTAISLGLGMKYLVHALKSKKHLSSGK